MARTALELRPNPGPEQVPEPFDGSPWLASIAIIGLSLVLTWLLGPRLRRWLRLRPPTARALRQARLAELGGLLAEHPGECIAGASQLLRDGLAELTSLPLARLTTPEILDKTEGAEQVAQELRPLLTALLQQADAVKFSGECPSEDEARTYLAGVAECLDRSRR